MEKILDLKKKLKETETVLKKKGASNNKKEIKAESNNLHTLSSLKIKENKLSKNLIDNNINIEDLQNNNYKNYFNSLNTFCLFINKLIAASESTLT